MRYRAAADRRRCAVTRGVLKTLLTRYLHIPVNELEFTHNEYGKPALRDSPLEFNVSHSGDYALLGFARESPLGVDVEHMRDDRVVNELALRVLSPGEYQRFVSLPEADRKRTFFQIWALKESVLKGMGSGLTVPPENIEISFYPEESRLLTAPVLHISDVKDWTLQSLAIGDDDYSAAVAVKHRSPLIELKHFESHSPDSI